jgi:hypothetical protein
MVRNFCLIFGLFSVLCAATAIADSDDPAPPSQHFAVIVHGYWDGQGDATVSGGTVQITAAVHDDLGNTGTLSVSNLKITDGHYFSGTGTVCGLPMKINGRVDFADPPPKAPGTGKGKSKDDESVVTDARIGATFNAGSHAGRIAGGGD